MPYKSIVVFIPSLSGGGAERVAIYLANELAGREGLTVTLITMNYRKDLLNLVSSQVKVVPLYHRFKLISYIRLSTLFCFGKFDLWLSHLRVANILTGALNRMLFWKKTKCILVEHTDIIDALSFNKSERWLSWLVKIAYQSSHICSVSEGSRDSLNKFLNRNDCKHIPNPVYTESFQKECKKRYITRPRTDLLKLLYVGRLSQEKGIMWILSAISQLKLKLNFTLDIYGVGPKDQDIRDFVSKHDLDSSVFLHGYTSDLYEIYNGKDVLLQASEYEGFGLVVAEAIAYNVFPLVNNCKSGPSEIVKSMKKGSVYEKGDMDQFISQLLKLSLGDLPEIEIDFETMPFLRYTVPYVTDQYLSVCE